ncbi:B-cell receptor CD22-like [Periophthalmus magnuspinnatus]|uniref:B-cell receptor CD22-like n=1 Tax=Periophthalmus magnuspinnatus TaxID=409849 RepID=UPI0024370A81|nr:B-cell receptor CD22-like [Periophthalmus magnuspinnatus]
MILILLLSSGADGCGKTNNLNFTTPSPMEALSGSCLWIPCTYKPVNTNEDINTENPVTGFWFKGVNDKKETKYVFSVSGDSSKSYPMNITGNLKNKSCTTMFYNLNKTHNDKYYFRVENSGFRATAACDSLQIKVRDSPWSPTIEVSGKQTETEVVTITCSAVTPCPHAPPQLTWDLHQGTAHITETNGTFTTKITQNITLTDAHDGLMIKCNAAYPVSGGTTETTEYTITLNVTYGPKDTSVEVSPSGSLSAGQSVTLSCSSRAKPPVHHFTWFRHSSQGPANVSQGHTYSFNICEGGDYYCVASNTHGNGTSPDITLQITAAPGVPSIEVSGKQTETEVVTITCSAVTPCPHAPPQLTWDLHQGTAHITETSGTFTTKITQNITLTDAHDGLMIKCNAAYPVSGGTTETTEYTITLNVTYGPKNTSVKVSPSGSLSAGQSVTLSCSSRAKPPVHHFTWFRHSSQGPANVSQGHTYSFNLTEEGQYYCVASNTLGNESSPAVTLSITDRDSPWSPTIEVSGKQTETEVVTITCSAVTPCPHAPPQLTWDLHQGTAHITETNGTFTTKITQNITLTDAHDGLMIKCNAAYPVSGGFKMADSNVTLSVSYGPKNTSVEVSPSGSLSAGQSVTLSCSSRAKPPVHHFTWFRHSSQGPANVNQGHTYSFNICEGGDYYCVASNTHGNGTSQDIHLRINDPAGFPWYAILSAGIGLLLVVCLIVFLYFKPRCQAPEEEEEEEHYVNFSIIKSRLWTRETAQPQETEESPYVNFSPSRHRREDR